MTTIDGEVIYRHKASSGAQLVQPYVAAGVTDLMQSAVTAGSGRAAQIGRPAAGKTGTTSSNKDGWFLGFSSGLTTGVWMGRDDARAVGNLQGGNAPATAWGSYMRVAVSGRPVEKFATDVTFPERLDGEEMTLGADGEEVLLDEFGQPIEGEQLPEAIPGADEAIEPESVDDEWVDRAMGRSREGQDEVPDPDYAEPN